MDELLHHLLIHQNNMDNENILIHRTLCRKMDTSAFFSLPLCKIYIIRNKTISQAIPIFHFVIYSTAKSTL